MCLRFDCSFKDLLGIENEICNLWYTKCCVWWFWLTKHWSELKNSLILHNFDAIDQYRWIIIRWLNFLYFSAKIRTILPISTVISIYSRHFCISFGLVRRGRCNTLKPNIHQNFIYWNSPDTSQSHAYDPTTNDIDTKTYHLVAATPFLLFNLNRPFLFVVFSLNFI